VEAEPPELDEASETRSRIVAAVLFLLILLLLGVLWWAMSQDRDILRGDEHFSRQRYAQALEYYLKSQRRGSMWGRPGLLLKIGWSYERLGQHGRAGEFFFKVLTEFPESPCTAQARSGAARAIQEVGKGDAFDPAQPGSTTLVRARSEWHKRYNRLVLELRKGGPGVSAQLEQAYREYKVAYEAYVREVKAGLLALDEGS